MWILASTGSLIGFSLGTAIISFFLIRHSRRYLAKQRPHAKLDAGAVVDQSVAATPPRSLPADLSHWHVQMLDTARDLMGELDSKMRVLQVLIHMADDSSARLEAAVLRAKWHGSQRRIGSEELKTKELEEAESLE